MLAIDSDIKENTFLSLYVCSYWRLFLTYVVDARFQVTTAVLLKSSAFEAFVNYLSVDRT
jgi:hypothetical protein